METERRALVSISFPISFRKSQTSWSSCLDDSTTLIFLPHHNSDPNFIFYVTIVAVSRPRSHLSTHIAFVYYKAEKRKKERRSDIHNKRHHVQHKRLNIKNISQTRESERETTTLMFDPIYRFLEANGSPSRNAASWKKCRKKKGKKRVDSHALGGNNWHRIEMESFITQASCVRLKCRASRIVSSCLLHPRAKWNKNKSKRCWDNLEKH